MKEKYKEKLLIKMERNIQEGGGGEIKRKKSAQNVQIK